MSASRVSPPDMSGLTGDWERLKKMRSDSDQQRDQDRDATTSRDHDATNDSRDQEHDDVQEDGPADPVPQPRARRRTGGSRPAPRAADAVALTVRFEPEESDEVDDFLREVRRAAGLRRLDKAEMVRELLRLAREHEPTRKALLRRLR